MNVPTLAMLANNPLWVAWQQEDRPDGKPTKVPYAPGGGKARADDPKTWGTRPHAEAKAAKLPKPYGLGGVGIELASLGDGRNLGGIDLDTCRDPETGKYESWAEDIIATFDTYGEVSPSNTGAKLFFTYDSTALPSIRKFLGTAEYSKLFQRGKGEHPPAIELHLGNRYFTVTDALIEGGTWNLRHVEAATIERLLQFDGPAFKNTDDGTRTRHSGTSAGADRSRSSAAFRVGKSAVHGGADFDEMCEALRADPETRDWMREKGEANGYREARRIFEKAQVRGRIIRVVAGELHANASEGEAAIVDAGLPIFQRGASLVRPVVQEVPAARGRMTVSAALSDIGVHGLIDAMCASATWEKFDARADDWLRINPPKAVADILLSRVGMWNFPLISGVATCPTLRPDGSILSAPGYDPATRLFHAADPGVTLASAVYAPNRGTAEKALEFLDALLTDFPFTNATSRSVALSGLITPVVRGALSVVPLHAIRANTPGTGKSYYVDTASAISTGRPCPVSSVAAGADEAETEKRVAGLLLGGFPIVCLDNVNGQLGGDLLCQAIERPLIRIRRLGGSDSTEVENRATMFATGNGLRVRGDMCRRTLICDLDAKLERPELRSFTGDPVATVMANRSRYISACLIIVGAYLADGAPETSPAIASFADWSRIVRSALIWLGRADPAASMEAAREDDPELEELRTFIGTWRDDNMPMDQAMTVAEIVSRSEAHHPSKMGEPTELRFPELRDLIHRMWGEYGAVNTKRMAGWLRGKAGRVVDGFRIVRDATDGHGGLARWRVRAV